MNEFNTYDNGTIYMRAASVRKMMNRGKNDGGFAVKKNSVHKFSAGHFFAFMMSAAVYAAMLLQF